ncbi:putative RNA-binding protein associated with RNAse of E/G family [Kribbella rubisoli]|uniref:RNA-binding protein associated with RNAse of E/G family n=2 Tax=Kribbella rubisoli TaxID=3075929 RepID=A0A4V2FYU0_9ACTN|nr:putative RNA-binding protein associated with RNAse of E/G family [Kribbella rubisoli]
MTDFWEPGTTIEWVYEGTGRHADKPNVRPMTVVRDDADGLVAWLAPGTPLLKPVLVDGRETRHAGPVGMFTEERVLKLDIWHGTGILKVSPPGKPWSVWYFWGEDGTFLGWYVNLEREHVRDWASRRTSTVDHVLDLWMKPDRTIEWKDEDELEGAVAAGRFTVADAERIVGDAHAAIRDIEAWSSPFSDDWQFWTPPPSWRVPAAPTTHQPTLIAEELHS